MTKTELEKKIKNAMVEKFVAHTTSDVKIITMSEFNKSDISFQFIDVAIIRCGNTKFIVRISHDSNNTFSLHNIYNVDAYLSSYMLLSIENAIRLLND